MNRNTRIRRILVAHDFGTAGDRALAWATDLAKRIDASLDVLHVCEAPKFGDPEALVGGAEPAMEIERTARRELDRVAKRLTATGVNFTTVIRCGVASEQVTSAAELTHADLIAVGTEGRTGIARAVLGSVAEAVMRTAPCPVVALRADARAERTAFPMSKVEHVLVAVDFEPISRGALAGAIALARAVDASMTVLHVYEQPDYAYGSTPLTVSRCEARVRATAQRALDEVVQEARGALANVRGMLRSGSVAEEILASTRDLRPDVVVVGTHGRQGVRRLLLGSIAEHVVRLSSVPVFTVRGSDEAANAKAPREDVGQESLALGRGRPS